MTTFPVSLDAVNQMSAGAFVDAFGDVAEHAPWVAEAAAARRPFPSRDAVIGAFGAAADAGGSEKQRGLLLAHPDVAGKAALTRESRSEQAGAGLNTLTADEFARFNAMNAAYRARHGIPFILAVKGATKHDILAAFAARTPNAPA